MSWGTYPETDFSYKVRADYELKVKFGTFSCLTITESSPITDFVGEFWCDEIIELTAETFTFKSSDGELTTLYRMPWRVITKINASKVDRLFLHHNFSASHGIGILYILYLAHNKFGK